jgi:hypothetical protein
VVVNEELDLEVVVRQLNQENALLRQELQLLRSGPPLAPAVGGSTGDGLQVAAHGGLSEGRTALSQEEQAALLLQVQAFVVDPSPLASLELQPSMLHIHAALGLLKAMARNDSSGVQQLGHQFGLATPGSSGSSELASQGQVAQLHQLQCLVHEQEQRIAVLTGVIRKQRLSPGLGRGSKLSDSRPTSSSGSLESSGTQDSGRETSRLRDVESKASPAARYSDELLADKQKAVSSLLCCHNMLLLQAHACHGAHRLQPALPFAQFEYFCGASPAHDAVAEHKAVLKSRYDAARQLGSQVAAAKQRLGQLKAAVEQRRLARSMAALLERQRGRGSSGGGNDAANQDRAAEQDAEEERLKALIDKVRRRTCRATPTGQACWGSWEAQRPSAGVRTL